MDMTTDVFLWAYNNDPTPEPQLIELYENEKIATSMQFTDITDFTATGGFSREFRIPANDANDQFFGPIFDVNLAGWFDFRKKVRARIAVNTIDIFDGYIQVKRVFRTGDRIYEYQIVFFAEAVNLAKAIGDKMLSEIEGLADDLTHPMDYSVMADSVDGTLLNGYLIWSLMDRGQNFGNEGTPGTHPTNDSNEPLYVGDFTPSVNGLYLWNQIIADAGFYWDHDAGIEAELEQLWIPWFNAEDIATDVVTQNQLFKVYRATDLTALTGVAYNQIVGLTEEYDNGGDFATPSYTAPYTGWFNFRAWAHVTRTAGSDNALMQLQLTDASINVYPSGGGVPVGGSFSSTQLVVIDPTWIFLSQGDVVTLYLHNLMPNASTYTVEGGAVGDTFTSGSGWMMTEAGQAIQGADFQPILNAPEMKQIEFFRSIVKMFNLVVIPDRTIPNKFTVQFMTEYLGSGTTRDWTPKLDLSKDVQIYPTNEFQSRTLLWTYKPDGDLLNKLFQDQAGRTYGWLRILDTGNDFATGENKVELDFSATPCNAVPGSLLIIPKFLNDQGGFFKPRPRILLRAGTSEGVYVWDDVSPTPAATDTEIIMLSHYSDIDPTVADDDLNFGQETPLQTITAAPYNTLYNRFWRNYIREIYGGLGTDDLYSQPFIMEAYFNLSTADMYLITFADQIWIQDAYWRVLEITDHVLGGEEVTKVKLMKFITNELECTWTPYSSGVGGLITFVAADGVTTGAGTEECCNKYNYYWDSANVRCYAFAPGEGPKMLAVPPSPGQGVNNTGAQQQAFMSIATNYAVQPSDYTILVDNTGGVRTITLPDAAEKFGRIIVVKKIDSSGNKTVVDGGPSNIDGATSIDITTQYASRVIQSTGTEWSIIAEK